MSSTVNKIVITFPFPTILPIVDKPNYKTLAKVHFKLNANFASVQSNIGDRQLGVLYLTVSPDDYKTLSATAFIPLVNRGATEIITAGATATVIANERRSFTDTTKLFKQYDSTDKSPKQMLLGTVD